MAVGVFHDRGAVIVAVVTKLGFTTGSLTVVAHKSRRADTYSRNVVADATVQAVRTSQETVVSVAAVGAHADDEPHGLFPQPAEIQDVEASVSRKGARDVQASSQL